MSENLARFKNTEAKAKLEALDNILLNSHKAVDVWASFDDENKPIQHVPFQETWHEPLQPVFGNWSPPAKPKFDEPAFVPESSKVPRPKKPDWRAEQELTAQLWKKFMLFLLAAALLIIAVIASIPEG